MDPTFSAPRGVGGTYTPPPDKSITHRALMLAAVAEGRSRLRRPLSTGDCVSTRRCLESLGVKFTDTVEGVEATGVGLRGFTEPRTGPGRGELGDHHAAAFRASCGAGDFRGAHR